MTIKQSDFLYGYVCIPTTHSGIIPLITAQSQGRWPMVIVAVALRNQQPPEAIFTKNKCNTYNDKENLTRTRKLKTRLCAR